MKLYQTIESNHEIQFISCRILQFAFDGNSCELWQLLQRITKEQLCSAPIQTSLQIVNAVNDGDYEFILKMMNNSEFECLRNVIVMFAEDLGLSSLAIIANT